MSSPGATLPIDRAALSVAFQDQRTRQAFETLFQQVFSITPAALAALTEILASAQVLLALTDTNFAAGRVLQGGTGVTIDTGTAGLAKVLVNVATALGYTPANQTDVVALETGAATVKAADGIYATGGDVPSFFPNGRILTGGANVAIDLATPNVARVNVDCLAYLNGLGTIALTRPLTANNGSILTGGVILDALEVLQTPALSATASDGYIPVSMNGVIWYLRLSSTP